MILTLNNTCDELTVTPEEVSIENISNYCCTTLTLGTNCCTINEQCIRAPLTITPTISDFGTELVSDVLYSFVDFTFSGIDMSCVEQLEITNPVGASNSTYNSPVTNPIRVRFLSNGVYDISVMFRTCSDMCLEYVLDIDLNIVDIFSSVIITNFSTTIPNLPTGVTIVGNTFVITPEAFGQDTTFSDGIYYVAISQDGVIENNSIFSDCDARCRVIDAISKDTCSNLFGIYQALVYSNDCSTIEYAQKCTIWEYLGSSLGYFTDSPCGETSDCGCNS